MVPMHGQISEFIALNPPNYPMFANMAWRFNLFSNHSPSLFTDGIYDLPDGPDPGIGFVCSCEMETIGKLFTSGKNRLFIRAFDYTL